MYGFSTQVTVTFENAVSQTTQALKEEGFGVLSDIDVQSTLKAAGSNRWMSIIISPSIRNSCPWLSTHLNVLDLQHSEEGLWCQEKPASGRVGSFRVLCQEDSSPAGG